MTYQGARARPADDESTRTFEVSKVRLDARGRVTDVLWVEVNRHSDHVVNVPVVVPVADVADALRDGARVKALFPPGPGTNPELDFALVGHEDGHESIGFDAETLQGRRLREMASLDAATPNLGRRGR